MLVKKLPKSVAQFVPLITVKNSTDSYGLKVPLKLEQCFFFDVETVAQTSSLSELSEWGQKQWIETAIKWISFRKNEEDQAFEWLEKKRKEGLDLTLADYQKSDEFYLSLAGLFPEFNKIICISFSFWNFKDKCWFIGSVAVDGETFKTEAEIIEDFFGYLIRFEAAVAKNLNGSTTYIVGHNINQFDVPVVFKRAFINNISTPKSFYLPNVEKWNQKTIDTIDIWRGGSKNGDNSLAAIMYVNGFENPKDDISGKDLTRIYYGEDFDIMRVVVYCEKDVVAIRDLMVKCQTGLVKQY